jgi:hypothetical protein
LPIIPDTQEVGIRKIRVSGQFRQKVRKTSILENKPRMKGHMSGMQDSQAGGLECKPFPGKKCETPSKK